MKLQVSFTVPLEVVVDIDAGTVRRVVVLDEAISAAQEIHTLDYGPVSDPRLRERAFAIATDPAEGWPAWELGW